MQDLAYSFNQMALHVEEAHTGLEQRIRERTAEVQQRSDQLRALALDITEAESRERKRLAQLLHDHFQQLVSAAKLKVGLLRRRLGEDSPLHETIVQAEQLLAETIDASRSLATELSPPVLHDAGLEPALDWLARRMERDHHLLVDVRVDPGCEPDNEQVRVILFEGAKELLFNVHKHSGADRATLTVTMPSTGLLQLAVSDEGRGFDPFMVEVKPKPDGSFGLFSFKERLSLLGGIVRVRSHAGSGTQVLLTVPVAVRTDGQTGGNSPRRPHDSVEGLAVDGVPNVRVLVADDHKLFREGLISLIGQEPFVDVVGQANDGQEAVELAHALKPDILICDITMPKLNGVQVTQQLSREMPELKIIGLSMHERDDMAMAMRDAGAIAYCTKGGPTETLLGVLRGVAGATTNSTAVPAETPEAPAV
jgi:CheY-like chemotaxis protein